MMSSVRVVLITDRRLCADIPARLADILALVPRGTVAIQLREKDLDGAALAALAREIQNVARPHAAPLWINERLDVALAVGATGVHLGERGLSIEDALATCGSLLVGCSRHRIDDVIAAGNAGAALVQLGPIWSTPGKGARLGPAALAVKTHLPGHVMLVAVGGIDSVDRAREAALAGADAVAIIRAAWTQPPALVAAMVAAVEAARH